MKATIEIPALTDALRLTSRAVLNSHPVMSGVVISAKGSDPLVMATNGSLSVTVNLDGETLVKDGTATAFPHAKFAEIVKSLAKFETVSIDADRIYVDSAKFRLSTLDATQFPSSDFTGELGAACEMPGCALLRMLEDVRNHIADDSTRYAITGVRFEIEAETIRCLATDGRRIAVSSANIGTIEGAPKCVKAGAFTLPSDAVATLIDFAKMGEADTHALEHRGERVRIMSPRGTIETSVVEGSFPPWRDVVPQDRSRSFKINAEMLARLTKRAQVMTNEESRGVKFAIADGKLVATSRAPEIGEAEIAVEVGDATADLLFGLNPDFLLDVAKACAWFDGDLTISNIASNKPVVIERGDDALFVIMPVSL
jgi:DNA polymerase III subunit beta